MPFIVNQFGDNPFAPGVTHDAYRGDQLVIVPGVTQPIVVASGVLARGTVLGEVSSYSILAGNGPANAGNGAVGAISGSAGLKRGTYALVATAANTFTVTDPEGAQLPIATVGQAYNQQGVQFTITAGSNAFAAGDILSLQAVNAVGQYVACVKTASDGSQTPKAILVDFVDASGGPATGGAYMTGEFNERAVSFDPSWNLPQVRDALRPYSIFLKASISGLEPIS